MACDPTQLLADAQCVMECIPPGNRMPVIIIELAQIMTAGLGGTTFNILLEDGGHILLETGDNVRKDNS
jgi:hypothetical protein